MHTLLVSYNFIAFMLLLPANLNYILAAPVNNEPKTMFDALAKKCPNLNQTTLKDNEQFTERCLEWEKINATTQLTPSNKVNVECLVLYEAVLGFCIGIGDHILLVKELIPSTKTLQNSNKSPEQVCENGIYPKTNTEHNISSIIRNNADCLLLCTDFTPTRISDICIWSYFFSTFNTSKFTQDLDKIHQQHSEVDNKNQAEGKPNPVGIVQASSKPIATPIEEKAGPVIDNAAAKLPAQLPQIKPQETGPVESQQAPVSSHQLEQGPVVSHQIEQGPIESHQIEQGPVESHQLEQSQNPVVGKPAENHDEKSVKPGIQVVVPSLPEQKQESPVDVSAVKTEVIPETAPKVPDNKKTENERPPDTNPGQAIKPETNPEKAPQENEENEAYVNEDKSQNNIADDVDRDLGIDDDDEQQEGEIKAEPAIPEENNEIKITSKKGKPASTVEDEAVSSFSLPEDDMDGDSYFFSYFTVIMCLFIVGYVGYHNRQKVLALLLEGKKGRRPGRARRPNSANYHKLDSNLEEAISSTCTKNASNVIY